MTIPRDPYGLFRQTVPVAQALTPQQRTAKYWAENSTCPNGCPNALIQTAVPRPDKQLNVWQRCEICLSSWEIDAQGNLTNRRVVERKLIAGFPGEVAKP